jgi:hypothetical protein
MPRLSLFAVFRDLSWKHLASCIYYVTGGIAKARLWKSKVTHYLKTARKCGLLVQWGCCNSYWGHPVHNTGLQERERKLDDIRAKSDSVKKM